MYSYTQLSGFLEGCFHPYMAVESSNGAEKTCRECGVTTLQLIKSFPLLSPHL